MRTGDARFGNRGRYFGLGGGHTTRKGPAPADVRWSYHLNHVVLGPALPFLLKENWLWRECRPRFGVASREELVPIRAQVAVYRFTGQKEPLPWLSV